MTELKEDTEKKILEAAGKVFIQKGFDGARMQEIANEAKINKALLHYYFRSKEHLFKAFIANTFNDLFPQVKAKLISEISFNEFVKDFIFSYINFLKRNPYLPMFILREINRDPNMVMLFLNGTGISVELRQKFHEFYNKQVEAGKCRKIDSNHLMLNVISLSIFPIASLPMMKNFLFKDQDFDFEKFMDERANVVYDFVINSLRP
jgi:TetR/AcrR family transcriptional regulator